MKVCLVAALIIALNAPGTAKSPALPDVDSYDGILKRYVLENGTVRYAALKAGIEPLSRFVEQIAAVSPDSHPELFVGREQKLAYWLNTYNALVLWAFAKDYPEKKDRLKNKLGQLAFFYRTKFKVGGAERSLDDIETNSIRKAFNEPRIHFAIVCASSGCPWLSQDAFRAQKIAQQLEERTRLFLSQERNVRVDAARREVMLSKIFDWFRQDFGPEPDAVLRFVGRYRTPNVLIQGKWKIRYFQYDWRLNEASETGGKP